MTFLSSFISTTMILTPVILMLLLLTPLLDKKYAAAGRYWMWLLLMIALYVPFASFIPRPVLQINVPVSVDFNSQSQSKNIFDSIQTPEPQAEPDIIPSQILSKNGEDNMPDIPDMLVIPDMKTVPANRSFTASSLLSILLFLWLAGIAGSFVYQIIIYLLFRRYIKRWSAPVKESGLIAVLDGERVRMNLRGNIRLRYCKGIKTPMLAGFVKPWLLLPDPLYNTEDLPLIFRHELTHYKRRDLWYKLALTITKSIFWFNPAVHLMAVQANKDIETICDTLTVSGMDITQRKRYSEIILNMAADPRVCQSRFTTCFVGGKNMLEQRFSNILGAAKKNGVAVFTFLGILILTAGILVGFRFTPKPQEIPSGIEDDTILSDTITLFAPKVTTDNVSKTESKYNNGLTIDGNDIKINGIPLKEYYSDNNPDVYNNLDELKKLLYDEAKVTEREFESVSSLNISSGNDHVSVSHGGDKLLIRYYEWIENQYSLEINNSELILKENNRPYYKTGNMYTDGWIVDCLKSMGKQTYTIIEIVIPESMKLDDITINVGSGSITVAGCVLDSEVTLNVGSGQVSLENSSFDDNASINSGSGTIAAKNCIFNEWVSLDTGSGTINAVSCTFSGKASVGAGSGLLNVENCNLGQNISLSVGSGIGYLKLANSAKEYDISFIASSGRLIYNDNAIEDNTLHNKNAASKIKLSVSSGSFNVTDMN